MSIPVEKQNNYDYDSVCNKINALMYNCTDYYTDYYFKDIEKNIAVIINNTPFIVDHICVVGLAGYILGKGMNAKLKFAKFYFETKNKLNDICNSIGLNLFVTFGLTK